MLVGRTTTVLATYGRQDVLQGLDMEAVVVVAVPNVGAARAWYHGPAWDHRFRGAASGP